MDAPKVFIIVLNYNNWSDTYECLKSVQEIEYSNYQVVIVDNGSAEKPTQDLGVKVIYNETNLGFSQGNNVGLKYALANSADYVLLLNNDTTVDKYFLKELVEVAQAKKECGLVGAKIYYAKKINTIWFAGGNISPYKIKGKHIGLGEEDDGQYDQIKKVGYITGCCLLIKKKVIDQIGYLDKDYFLYYEDADYCWRARRAGFDCLFAPKAKIWHKASVGLGEGSDAYIYYHSRNGLLLIRKNGNILQKISAVFVSILIIKKQIFKLIFMPKRKKWAKAVLKGIKDFYLKKYGRI